MDAKLEARLRAAVRDGIAARHAYYAAIDLPDEQELGTPANRDDISALERRLGKQLPPSYRGFLELYDGWRMIDGGVDLWPTRRVLDELEGGQAAAWQQQMKAQGDNVGARSLVIGASTITPTRYLLDPKHSDANGEWRLVQHHKGVEAQLASFLDFLEQGVDEYRQLAADSGADNDAV